MKSTASPKTNSRKPFFAAKTLLAAAIIMSFSSGAGAFSDGPALTQRIVVMVKQIKEYQDQLTELKAKVKQGTDQFNELKTKIDGITQVGANMDIDLKERDPDTFGMKEKCPGAGGIPSLGQLMSSFKLNPNAGLEQIKKDQQELCVRIVYAENLRFNESVRVINLMRKQKDKLREISKRRGDATGKEATQIEVNTNDLTSFISEAQTSSQYSSSVIEAYDKYIATLKDNQAMLTKVAMEGNQGDNGLVAVATRKLVQGAVLKGSLTALAAKDR